MRVFNSLATGLIIAHLGLPATAATITQTFDFSTVGFQAGNALTFSSGDVNLEVRGANYDTPSGLGDALDLNFALPVITANNFGLYITYLFDNDHRIDGVINEIATFAFNMPVTVTEILFGSIEDNSSFDFFVGDDGAANLQQVSGVAPSVGVNGTGTFFGIGASGETLSEVCVRFNRQGICTRTRLDLSYAAFKIKGLTVTYEDPAPVPLPAGGLLLAGAMAGLTLLRRRKTA